MFKCGRVLRGRYISCCDSRLGNGKVKYGAVTVQDCSVELGKGMVQYCRAVA